MPVIVVSANESTQHKVRRVLVGQGAEVLLASNAEEVLQHVPYTVAAARQADNLLPASARRPDYGVLMDLTLPTDQQRAIMSFLAVRGVALMPIRHDDDETQITIAYDELRRFMPNL